ncbi:MAG: NAD(P)/FAD-dependent oxidoreductase, partial [Lachnospiraceae bacterium]|nr:NAD(P)/FAD-dependent oxidoreductase [Lachnospiraceae bacterium]
MSRVIVIGAGASGLMAAAAAAENGHEVLVLERNEKAGKKIYITGKGRCNLTNACEPADFFTHIVRNPRFLYSAIYDFDAASMMAFLKANGCPVKTERGNRVFPVSDHASDVTAAILRYLHKKKVQIRYHSRVTRILTQGTGSECTVTGVAVRTDQDTPAQVSHGKKHPAGRQTETVLPADAVIVCTGGLSYPSTGSEGDGYRFAKEAGLDVLPAFPSLVPLTVREEWCPRLQGLSLKNVELTIREAGKKKPVSSGFGELLFTHFGISGPLVLTASAKLDFAEGGGDRAAGDARTYEAYLNLKPALTREQLIRRIGREIEAGRGKEIRSLLRALLPARLADAVAVMAFGEGGEEGGGSTAGASRRASSLQDKEIASLADLIQNVPMTITGTRGFSEAVVTR